jgi:hypothetical protein
MAWSVLKPRAEMGSQCDFGGGKIGMAAYRIQGLGYFENVMIATHLYKSRRISFASKGRQLGLAEGCRGIKMTRMTRTTRTYTTFPKLVIRKPLLQNKLELLPAQFVDGITLLLE